MKLFLAGCIVLLVMLALTVLIRMRKPHQQATRNRVRSPRHSVNSAADKMVYSTTDEPMDPDVVLGLKKQEPPPEPVASVAVQKKKDYLVLYVMSFDNKNYGGYELLQALLANGLRYEASDKLFHAYDDADDRPVFALASVNQPGTFDLPTMSQFYCPGLTLFMVLSDSEHPHEVFERMLETAHQLAEDLGGEVWGEDRQLLTSDTLYDLRQRLKSSVVYS